MAPTLAPSFNAETDPSFDVTDDHIKVYRRRDLPEIEPDYASDSSDESVINTVGNVPIEWYKDYPHIGYDVDGKKILKPAKGDELEEFLALMDDPESQRTVFDDVEKKNVALTKEQAEIMKRIMRNEFPDADFDPHQPTVEWFTSKVEIHPLTNVTEPKSRFIPSKMEAKKIMKIAGAIKKGWITLVPELEKVRNFAIWNEDDEEIKEHPMHIPAPKLPLPGKISNPTDPLDHNESYNPPAEYLLNPEELNEWKDLDPQDRPFNFIPQKFPNLRSVSGYDQFIQERFQRCLDLYLCPRMKKNKINIDPESLIPKLPSPKDLQPFPSSLAIVYKGHTGKVRSISVDPTGLWLASASEDKSLRIWEVSTGYCVKKWTFEDSVNFVSWNPSKNISVLAAASGNYIHIMASDVCSDSLKHSTSAAIDGLWASELVSSKNCTWVKPSAIEKSNGHLVKVELKHSPSYLCWHRKGDYFASVCTEGTGAAALVHQLSKGKSQAPFNKLKGLIQRVLFHPNKPLFFVATQQSVRIYNLMKQEMMKKLQSGVKWISSIDIHPGGKDQKHVKFIGDNIIIGSYDKRLCWFDTDLSTKPYKTLRYHKMAIRDVAFHKRYPLFASSSDDGSVNIFHGMVYSDLERNPLLVPVKSLQAHRMEDSLGALACEFHPIQPWIFTCGADTEIKLFS